jgi:hypothetical protein
VGDFNLSRFLSKGSQFVQSSQLVNPRWCAPEVIEVGHYSKAADVYSFGIILWELLTWQQPYEQRGGPRGVASTFTGASAVPTNNWQIMNAVKGAVRPLVPPADDLPGGAPPPQLLSEYVALMEACWHQDPTARPNFKTIIAKLRTLLGAVRTPGGGPAAAAAGPGGPDSAVEPVSNGTAAAASTQAGVAADSSATDRPAGAAEASTPGSWSPAAAAAAAGGGSRAAVSPAIADLLNLGDEDGQPGTSSSSRHTAPRATTAVACPEQGPASLPRKTSGPRASPFANAAAAAAVGDVSDASGTLGGMSSGSMGFSGGVVLSTAAAVAAAPGAAAAATAQSPFAAVDVQQQKPLSSGGLSGPLLGPTHGTPDVAAAAAGSSRKQAEEGISSEQERAASLNLLGDELPISTMLPAAAPPTPVVAPATAASPATAVSPWPAAAASASGADRMPPWLGPPVQHSHSYSSSTMWLANPAGPGPASFSAPRHIQSMPALSYGMPAWQHGWYVPQQPPGQFQSRPLGQHPPMQQQPQPPQQQQQHTAMKRH